MWKKTCKRKISQLIFALFLSTICIIGCQNANILCAEDATAGDAVTEEATAGDAVTEEATAGDAMTEEATVGDAVTEEMQVETAKLYDTMSFTPGEPEVKKEKYCGEYHIDYILSHYSYFVKENLSGDFVADTIGAVMVGNELNLKNTVGKVKYACSYAKYLIDLADYPTNSWNDTSGIDTNFYYNEECLTYKDWLKMRMTKVEDDYIDMDDAFATIKQESDALAKAGSGAKMEDGALVLDFSSSNAITVSGVDYKNASCLILKNVTPKQLLTGAYTVSVTGNDDFMLDTSRIFIGTQAMNNNFFFRLVKDSKEAMQGGQYYAGGFGLIWNFPDADTVTANFLAGHLVAPFADVSMTGGNHEGQVIAKNINTSSESHFYPYNITTEVPTTTEAPTTELPTTTEAPTTERPTTTEAPTTTEILTTTEATTTTEAPTTTETPTSVIPKASSTSMQMPSVSATETVQTGDTMALGIVVSLLITSAGLLLLFTVLKENKKK